MRKVKYLIKIIFWAGMVAMIAAGAILSFIDVLMLLFIAAIYIFMEKYNDSFPVILVNALTVLVGVSFNQRYVLLLCPLAFDFMYRKAWPGILFLLPLEWLLLFPDREVFYILLVTLLCGLLGYIIKAAEMKESEQMDLLDGERRLRYELENAKSRLEMVVKESANLAEVKERNRIAREIHDSVGHHIAGILIQLQVAAKVFEGDKEKSAEILDRSISGLSGTLTLLRDTVHNIKPLDTLGIAYIRKIADDFGFCPVSFTCKGDVDSIPPSHMEILCVNVKEALTNIAKHSKATNVEISIESTDKYTRLYMKDNGVGCQRIKPGFGLSGMRERVENAGGNLSISAEEGFLIVALLQKEVCNFIVGVQ